MQIRRLYMYNLHVHSMIYDFQNCVQSFLKLSILEVCACNFFQTAAEKASDMEEQLISLQSELKTAQADSRAFTHRVTQLEILLEERQAAHNQVCIVMMCIHVKYYYNLPVSNKTGTQQVCVYCFGKRHDFYPVHILFEKCSDFSLDPFLDIQAIHVYMYDSMMYTVYIENKGI